MTRIVAISDTHGFHDDITLPPGDILIHAGDISMRGRGEELDKFGRWFEKQKDKFKHRIIIAGNHDFMFQINSEHARSYLDDDAIYLEDSDVTVEGLKIYGSPYSNMFHNWAFMAKEEELAGIYSFIPNDIDILITHGPAFSILDQVITGDYAGSHALYERIKTLTNLKIHICGHIHESAGHEVIDNVRFYNVSTLNRYYRVQNLPVIIEV